MKSGRRGKSFEGVGLHLLLAAAIVLAACVPRERAARLNSVDDLSNALRRASEGAAGVCVYYYSNDRWLRLSQGLEQRDLATQRFRQVATKHPVIVVPDDFRDVRVLELYMRDGSVEAYFEPTYGVKPGFQGILQNSNLSGCYGAEELRIRTCERSPCDGSAISIGESAEEPLTR